MQNLRNLTRRIFRLTNRGTETARDADYTLGESYRRDDLVTHDASQEPMGEPWARWRGTLAQHGASAKMVLLPLLLGNGLGHSEY